MEARAFPGPFCKEHNLTYFSIFESKSMPLLDEIKNGLVLELRVLYKNDCALLIEIIKHLCTPFKDINYKTLQTYILRLVEKKNKFSSKKKVKGYDNVHAFLNDIFSVGKTSCTNVTQDHTVTTCTSQSNKEVEKITLQIPCDNSSTCENASECTSREILNEEIEIIKDIRTTRNSPEKKNNELKFEIDKKLKHIAKLKDEVKRLDENINRRNKLLGHYSVKNVNKREDTAKKNIQVLRETQRKLARDSKLLQSTRTHNKELLVDRSLLQQENDQLKKEITDLKNTLDEEIKKKQKAQKAASYWKTKSRGGAKSEHTNTNSTTEVTDPSSEFCDYDFECGEEFHTKNDDGTFSDSLRMCIIELAALEVAVEKVSPVIKSVTKHLFNREILKEDLPSSTTVQSIIDEGHYLAKSFIAERLGETESWGLHRDGTTRKRQKILDTSITLSSGDVMSLGFSRVSHETAVEINKTTQEHIKELADLQPNSDDSTSASSYVRDSLQKLAYTMSDRAANEKKASQLLDEWRDSIIETSNGIEKTEVLRFHCMAHCLLGFHTYACTDLRDFEFKLKSDNGPFGRDALSCYKTPFKKGRIAERAVQSTSSIFGPVGDHYGARDLWEAYCASKGIKSLISNYKDNRFNGIFQTSAEIIVHRKDFIAVLETIRQPNLKIKAVLADLKSDILASLLQAFGLLYVRFTGPYWNLITDGDVPYLKLYEHVTEMHKFLEKCSADPEVILEENQHWSQEDPLNIRKLPHQHLFTKFIFNVSEQHKEIIISAVKCIVGGMKKTVEKQLKDFLPGGSFSMPSQQDIVRTKFAPVTNLSCEHHFGDLDSSQRRRPHASMHHHSSIQLLKRNRAPMMNWLEVMPSEKRENLMKSARKGAKILRRKHLTQERMVVTEISQEIQKSGKNLKKRKNLSGHDDQQIHHGMEANTDINSQETPHTGNLTTINELKIGQYVAVAYDDNWYPGMIIGVEKEQAVVKFLHATKTIGLFQWPPRDDIQSVHPKFILKHGFVPECLNSGRLWKIVEINDFQNLYARFKRAFW